MRILQTITACTGIFCLFSFTNTELPVKNYINQYRAIAVQEMHRTGIPASITLAQGIIESRFGTSGLSKNSNNHFGIKCKGDWKGGKYYYKDDDYVNGKLIKSCFRTYKSPEESYYDHSEFLLINQRYSPLFELERTDYKGWAKGLKKCGYATAKEYANTLINTIEKYQLHLYDYQQAELLVKEELIAPKAERIPEYINFPIETEATISSLTVVAQINSVPPPPSYIPESYNIGDGLKQPVIENNKGNFNADVFGGSSRYLDNITPQFADRD